MVNRESELEAFTTTPTVVKEGPYQTNMYGRDFQVDPGVDHGLICCHDPRRNRRLHLGVADTSQYSLSPFGVEVHHVDLPANRI